MKLALFLVSCAVCQVSPPVLAGGSWREAVAVPGDQVREWLRAESEWEPDAAAALAAARMRLYAVLGRRPAVERPSLSGRFLAPDRLSNLLSHPGVLWRQNDQRRERAYGTVWRVRLEVGLRHTTIDNWAGEILARARRERALILAKLGVTAAGLVLAGLLVRVLDRWTRGYRRTAVILMGGALAATVMLAVWWN